MITDIDQYKELIERIQKDSRLRTVSGKLNSAFLRRDNFTRSELYADIIKSTEFLDVSSTIAERIFCIENQITQRMQCVCGQSLHFINSKGYLKSCNKCVRRVNTPWKTSSTTSKSNISQEKNNLYDYISNDQAPESTYDEAIEFISSKSEAIAECKKWVSREDYRRKLPILKKIVNLTKYIPWTKSDYSWSNRMYNVAYNLHEGKLCEVCKQNKTRFINFLRGYTTCCDKKECVQTLGCKHRVDSHLEIISPVITQQGFEITSNENYNGLNYAKLSLSCNVCKNTFDYNLSNGNWKNIRCRGCYGESGISHEEKTVLDFIQQHTTDVKENCEIFDNNQKELDIYVPKMNLAIEYNGVLWHSFGTTYPNNIDRMQQHKNNHFTKHKLCKDRGIKLLQITSTEWTNKHKQIIWKSILLNHLKLSKRIYARKCEIVELDNSETNDFLNRNHLQGMSNAKVRLGLKFNDQIVSVMTFSKPRFNKNYQWELIRFCNLLDHTVIGGASKLFNFFCKKYTPTNVISYADVRYSDGELYKALGFTFVKYTPPSYSYIRGDRNISRFAAQKHRLQKLLPAFDESKTELQNMLDAGYRRMWDAGTMLFKKSLFVRLTNN